MSAVNTLTVGAPERWNFKRLAVVFAVALMLQSLVLPCLCDIGRAKMIFALVFDLLMIGRAVIAYFAGERGTGWKLYAWMFVTSPLWIEAITYLVFGET